MKPKTIDEVLGEFGDDELIACGQQEVAKKMLLDLFMSCVPDEFIPSGCIENDEAGGFNDCREQMIKNLEKLK